MVSGLKTSSPVAIIIGIVAVGAIVLAASNLPDTMPPDPFEEDELREIILEVEWDGDFRTQLIAWDAGDEEDELETLGQENVGAPGWHWNHITTAQQGTTIRLSAVQGGPGPVLCAIYEFNRQLDADSTTDPHGCLVEVTLE